MAQFCMRIAEHTAQINALFASTPDYFHRYLTDAAPEFSVTVCREDLAFEQAELLEEAHREGFRPRVFTDPFLERAVIQRAFAEYLFDFDTLMLHGSTVALDGNGYLFAAKSGTGKSTHTRLWLERFGQRAYMINDDKPFLHISETGVWAHGSPWSGKHGLDTNTHVPLKGICLLERGTENRISPTEPVRLLPMLLKQAYCPTDPAKQARFLALLDRLTQAVPLWHLYCTKTPDAAEVSYNAMSGQ